MIPESGKDRHAKGTGAEIATGMSPSTPEALDWPSGVRSVVQGVCEMESALSTGDVAGGISFADAVVAMTTDLLDAIDLRPCEDPEWDAELISTLRVYRNGAFVFRSLPSVDAESGRDTMSVCMALLQQGHDHLRALVGQSATRNLTTPSRSGAERSESTSPRCAPQRRDPP
jgi:hypothetical protein